jgi:hypothetical protein
MSYANTNPNLPQSENRNQAEISFYRHTEIGLVAKSENTSPSDPR